MKYGFLVFDVVGFVREWCTLCTRQRYHEVYDGFKICLGRANHGDYCGNVESPPEPKAIEGSTDICE